MHLSLSPELPADEALAQYDDAPWAFTSVAELADSVDVGRIPSLIYVEGDLAIYLDEADTDQALQDVEERDLVLIEALVNLAQQRVVTERRRRNRGGVSVADFGGPLR